jgi:hypothetical protein
MFYRKGNLTDVLPQGKFNGCFIAREIYRMFYSKGNLSDVLQQGKFIGCFSNMQ